MAGIFLSHFLEQGVNITDDATLVRIAGSICTIITEVMHERNESLGAILKVGQLDLDKEGRLWP